MGKAFQAIVSCPQIWTPRYNHGDELFRAQQIGKPELPSVGKENVVYGIDIVGIYHILIAVSAADSEEITAGKSFAVVKDPVVVMSDQTDNHEKECGSHDFDRE